MSTLFTPIHIGNIELRNRVIHSATYESMATSDGEVTDQLINRYRTLAKGEIGLIIPGHIFVHKYGKAAGLQMGIHKDSMIPGLNNLVETVHREGGRIFFQLAHSGLQTTANLIGRKPMGPSTIERDKINLVKAAEMNLAEIDEAIVSFGEAARRAASAGADGIQLHCAHGYLISQFLSPFFNRRDDKWGGSDKNRFRFLKEVIRIVRENIPAEMPLMIKINTDDYTSKKGITPALTAKYVGWLGQSIDAVELSSGTSGYSFMNVCQGAVPIDDFVSGLPLWKRTPGRIMLSRLKGKHNLVEGYNIEAARVIKPALKGIPLSVVGGFRNILHMEEVLKEGYTDLISISRPFVREPHLLKRFRSGKSKTATCDSCNKCLAAVATGRTLRCYNT